jgi:small-conductance mechanosensitive channel
MRRARLVLVLISALVAALVATGGPAHAQAFRDFGLSPRAEQPAQADRAERPPDLQAYGDVAQDFSSIGALDMTQREVERFRFRLRTVLRRIPQIGGDIRETLERASPGGDPTFFLGVAALLLFLLAVGRAAATVFAVYVARPLFVGLQKPDPHGISEKLPVLAARIGLMAIHLTITLVVAAIVGSGFYPDDNAPAVSAAIVAFVAYATIRAVDTFWRMVLAPFLPEYRIPTLDDRQARRLYRWLYLGTLVSAIPLALLYWLESLDLHPNTAALLYAATAFVTAALALTGAALNRRAIRQAILGGLRPAEAGWLAAAAAALWGPAFTVFLVVSWAAYAYRAVLGVERGLSPVGVAFVVFMAALVVYAVILFALEKLARRRRLRRFAEVEAAVRLGEQEHARLDAEARAAQSEGTPLRDVRADGPDVDADDGEEGGGPAPRPAPRPAPPPRHTMKTFEDLATRVASLIALGAAAWALIALSFGREVFAEGRPLAFVESILDILLIGYVAYHAVRIWIDTRIEEEGGAEDVMLEPGDEGGAAAAASRTATLLPLVRNFLLILIVLSIAIFVAMEIGVNVAPLLGGAGVIGLAIGFGSQTLVRDILSGAFFLADDAFRKGEYIDVGGVKGTVEKISIRSFQLRHHLGALNTVPFGEVKRLTNFSRDWVMMKLPLRLTYDTDPEKVRKLIKKLGEELLRHPEEGRKFMQPLKSQGVYMMDDSAMIIRVKYMTKPGDQWTTRKLVYAAIRELFEKEGIKFAHREVTVRIPELEGDRERNLSEGEMKAIGAAARRAIDDADEALAQASRPRAVGDDR